MRRRKGEICFAVSIGRLASMKNGVPYSNAIICHGRPCRAEVRKWPALYRYPARDGQSPTTCKVDARSAHSTGLKTRSAAGRAPLNLVGGYRFSNATEIEADLACAHKNRLQCGASASRARAPLRPRHALAQINCWLPIAPISGPAPQFACVGFCPGLPELRARALMRFGSSASCRRKFSARGPASHYAG